ncbi:MAG: MBL fold metallo-hydrolase [Sphingobacteriales bacterium]|nr:MBL fold metallo-hydrolase [Sphingobacteriales bacterium]
MNLTIWGAAQQVTGSMHLLQTDQYQILIDCGLDYERNSSQEQNEEFPFNPSEIDLVILTHAHIDHSGNLPTLIRMGFTGQILCTHATKDLAELLLLDSVSIFLSKQRARAKGKHRKSQGPNPLYLQKHVHETIDKMVEIAFNKPFQVNEHIAVEFIPIGHLLGAAAVVLRIIEDGIEKKIAFTGDIGRKNYPLLPDPQALPPVDFLVCESTYGGRFHSQGTSIEEKLIETIQQACVKTSGRLIIPAFSIGRTQSLIYTLNRIFLEKGLPPIPIFVDSPLAQYATAVYRKHRNLLHPEAQAFYAHHGDEYEFENLTYTQNLKESKAITNFYEPCIIISSAGMLEGGRIQDHLYYNVQNLYCTLLFIGFCAPGTLGHKLLRGDSFVRIRDRELPVYATIEKTDLLSGHGDHADLMQVITQQKNLQKLFLVHGELSSMEELAQSASELGFETCIPKRGIQYTL